MIFDLKGGFMRPITGESQLKLSDILTQLEAQEKEKDKDVNPALVKRAIQLSI